MTKGRHNQPRSCHVVSDSWFARIGLRVMEPLLCCTSVAKTLDQTKHKIQLKKLPMHVFLPFVLLVIFLFNATKTRISHHLIFLMASLFRKCCSNTLFWKCVLCDVTKGIPTTFLLVATLAITHLFPLQDLLLPSLLLSPTK